VEIFIDHDKLLDTNVCTNAKENRCLSLFFSFSTYSSISIFHYLHSKNWFKILLSMGVERLFFPVRAIVNVCRSDQKDFF